MKTIFRNLSVVLMMGVVLVSCNSNPSLQEYYVDNQENNKFVMIDIPTSLISDDSEALDEEQKKVLKTVRKINIMAYPLKDSTTADYEAEQVKVNEILSGDNYEELMKFTSDEGKLKFYFKGEEDAIDEVIVFAAQDEKGFMLARLLGDDMNIGDMSRLAQSLQEGDIDLSGLNGVMDVFEDAGTN